MARLIGGIYEIEEKIGAGGGGIVYLGRHLRLEKQVVLKADKRTLNTKAEALRREVDMLKGLSHTYIPQVYDFVQEDGVVYTVMDFIEGESLDKILERGDLPSQPQVIQWAIQLLEALCYLHSQPPHGILHGDIKPANIMVRPNQDICLIDYNIALALGEDGAVKVGRSRGYASPEHYGIYCENDYSTATQRLDDEINELTKAEERLKRLKAAQAEGIEETVGLAETETLGIQEAAGETEILTQTKTVGISENLRGGESFQASYSSKGGKQSVMLDIRSDIYCLGATLYHLLSGHRPAENAFKVQPLGEDICSPAVSAIIKKAMAPDPSVRYQSAEEMLAAFCQLHRYDKRVLRRRRRAAVSAVALIFLFLTGGACTFVGLKQLEQRQNALALAEYSSNYLAEGNISEAIRLALQAIPKGNHILNAPVTAQAQKALTDALGVYDLSDGFKSLGTIEIPSVPFKIAVSPVGSRFAAVYQYEAAVFDLEGNGQIVSLPILKSALSDVVFVDESLIVYAGKKGVTAYDIDTERVLWTGGEATTLAVSEDRTVVAAVNRDEDRADVYNLSDGTKLYECAFNGRHLSVAANDIFADPKDSIFSLNRDGSMLAVSFSNGGLEIFDLDNQEESLILYDESEYSHFEGGFCGKYFAFAANKGDQSLFGLVDTEEAVYVGGYDSKDPFLLKTDEKGIYLCSGNLLVRFDPDTLEETELAYTGQSDISGFAIGDGFVLTAVKNQGFSFYDRGANLISTESSKEPCDFLAMAGKHAIVANRNEPSIRLMKLENHEESQVFSYDARYVHDEARISQDGQTAMLFSYKDFRIYDRNGQVLCESELPDADYIYDQQFVKGEDSSWLEVIWYDGKVRRYSGADGSLLDETECEPPSSDLYEEFYTDNYRFVSYLHGAPQVYDMKSNKLAAVLEKDSYLTYVTQVGEYIITEYISAAGERYGLLLNDNLQTLAYLPGLCDIAGEMLVFDYKSGNMRQCRLYSLQELTALGENHIK